MWSSTKDWKRFKSVLKSKQTANQKPGNGNQEDKGWNSGQGQRPEIIPRRQENQGQTRSVTGSQAGENAGKSRVAKNNLANQSECGTGEYLSRLTRQDQWKITERWMAEH